MRAVEQRIAGIDRRIAQIYNGVDIQRFHPRSGPRPDIPGCPFTGPELFVFGTVGRMQTVKAQTLLAQAFVRALQLQPEQRDRMRLVMVGEGPLRTESQALLDAALPGCGGELAPVTGGGKAGGKKVEVIVKDDAGVADTTRRLAQELVVNDKVVALAGFGITPSAMATAPIATQSKTPMVVMAAATSAITEASPFIVRTSFTLPQAAVAMGEWAPKNGIKTVVTLVSDYGPGLDAEKAFKAEFESKGGKVLDPCSGVGIFGATMGMWLPRI